MQSHREVRKGGDVKIHRLISLKFPVCFKSKASDVPTALSVCHEIMKVPEIHLKFHSQISDLLQQSFEFETSHYEEYCMTALQFETVKSVRNELQRCILRKEFSSEVELAAEKIVDNMLGLIKRWVVHMKYVEMNRPRMEVEEEEEKPAKRRQSLNIKKTKIHEESSKNSTEICSETSSSSGGDLSKTSNGDSTEDSMNKEAAMLHVPYDFTELFSSTLNEEIINNSDNFMDISEIQCAGTKTTANSSDVSIDDSQSYETSSGQNCDEIDLELSKLHEIEYEDPKTVESDESFMNLKKLSLDEIIKKISGECKDDTVSEEEEEDLSPNGQFWKFALNVNL